MISKVFKEYIIPVLLLVASALGGYYLAGTGYDSVTQMRQLERLPSSKVGAILPGEANVTAEVAKYRKTINSHYTKTPSVYYRFTEEQEEADSDGNRRWTIVDTKTDSVDFYVKDETGKALVHRSSFLIDWSIAQSFQTIEEGSRYTEWRIEQGDTVFIFAMAELIENQINLSFSSSGQYSPIISTYSEVEERSDMGALSIFQIWAGITLLSLCVYLVSTLFKVHRLVAYLSLLMCSFTLILSDMGLNMLRDDLLSGANRYKSQSDAAHERVAYLLQRDNLPFYGWNDLHRLRDSRYRYLDKTSKKKISEIRLNLLMARHLLIKPMKSAPAKWFVGVWGVVPPDVIPAPESTNKELQFRLQNYQPSELSKLWPGIFVVIGVILTGLFSWLGIRQVKIKRYIENLSTSSVSGVAYGAAEVKGKLLLPKETKELKSPLTQTPCVWYYYHVQEKRGAGKNTRWVSVKEETKFINFYCEDSDGKIEINAKYAEIITQHTEIKNEGAFRYIEQRLQVADDLYVIGYANLNKQLSKKLQISYAGMHVPFIISNESEQQVMIKKARKGILSLNVSFSSAVLTSLLIFGMSGGFSPTDFLLSASISPMFMMILVLVLHYNDIVFLRQRVDRNLSNIKVSLKKRYNLIPNIEQLVKDHAKHEAGLLESIVAYRSEFVQSINNVEHLSGLIDTQGKLKMSIIKIQELYPELKTDKLILKMMEIISAMENELMYMRRGYNDSVEVYNSRIKSVPDILFTSMFGFKEKKFIAI